MLRPVDCGAVLERRERLIMPQARVGPELAVHEGHRSQADQRSHPDLEVTMRHNVIHSDGLLPSLYYRTRSR